MKRMLMIIDPQIDFISGSMAVEGAAEKMDALIKYIEKMDGKYACKAVTLDWHPFNHCSFEENGGQWPMTEDSGQCTAYSILSVHVSTLLWSSRCTGRPEKSRYSRKEIRKT